MTEPADPPYRWDLVTPDRLGSLLDGAGEPDLWFLDDLVDAAGKVLARSGAGRLVFVGRSLDSMFDLLSGALSGVEEAPPLARLPLSFFRDWTRRGARAQQRRLTTAETGRVRDLLARAGASPREVVSRRAPTAFVDVVHHGGTFRDVHDVFRAWSLEQRVDRNSSRRKLRFVGVTRGSPRARTRTVGSRTSRGRPTCPRGPSSTCRCARRPGATSATASPS